MGWHQVPEFESSASCQDDYQFAGPRTQRTDKVSVKLQEKVIPIPRSLHPRLKWWLQKENVLQGQPLHRLSHALQLFADTSKEWWGSLRGIHCKGNLIPSRMQVEYKLSGTKGGLPGHKRIPRPLPRQDHSYSNRQHYSSCLYKQERRYEFGPTVCPSVENPDLLLQETGDSQGLTHSRPSECGSRQVIQSQSDHSNKLVSPSRHFSVDMQQPQIDLFATRFNNKLPQFVLPVPDPLVWAVESLSLSWEDLDPYAFPPVAILDNMVVKLQDYLCRRIILIDPGWPNMPWFGI